MKKIYYIWSTFYQGKVATPPPILCAQKIIKNTRISSNLKLVKCIQSEFLK